MELERVSVEDGEGDALSDEADGDVEHVERLLLVLGLGRALSQGQDSVLDQLVQRGVGIRLVRALQIRARALGTGSDRVSLVMITVSTRACFIPLTNETMKQ